MPGKAKKTDDAKKDEKVLSFQELLVQLKDPSLLQAAAAKHGMKIVPAQGNPQPTKKEETLEKPSFNIGKIKSFDELAQALNTQFQAGFDYLEKRQEQSFKSYQESQANAAAQQEQSKVRQFIDDKLGGDEDLYMKVFPTLKKLYSGDIEKDFARACKADGVENPLEKKEEVQDEKPDKTSSSREVSSPASIKSDEINRDDLEPKIDTVEDAASAAFDSVADQFEGVAEL